MYNNKVIAIVKNQPFSDLQSTQSNEQSGEMRPIQSLEVVFNDFSCGFIVTEPILTLSFGGSYNSSSKWVEM